jgi:hypothetical protein
MTSWQNWKYVLKKHLLRLVKSILYVCLAALYIAHRNNIVAGIMAVILLMSGVWGAIFSIDKMEEDMHILWNGGGAND